MPKYFTGIPKIKEGNHPQGRSKSNPLEPCEACSVSQQENQPAVSAKFLSGFGVEQKVCATKPWYVLFQLFLFSLGVTLPIQYLYYFKQLC